MEELHGSWSLDSAIGMIGRDSWWVEKGVGATERVFGRFPHAQLFLSFCTEADNLTGRFIMGSKLASR